MWVVGVEPTGRTPPLVSCGVWWLTRCLSLSPPSEKLGYSDGCADNSVRTHVQTTQQHLALRPRSRKSSLL